MTNYLIDTHAHIDMLEDMEGAIKNAAECGVNKIILPCAYPKDLEKIYETGMGYITDVGMTGPSESIIGMEINAALKRFLTLKFLEPSLY